MSKQLKLAFVDMHSAEQALQNQNQLQEKILNAVSGSLTVSQQFASLYDKKGQIIFSNAHKIPNSGIQRMFDRKSYDLKSIISTLELRNAHVEHITPFDSDDEDSDIQMLLVNLNDEFWKVQICPIEGDFIFLSATDVTTLMEVQNRQFIVSNLDAAKQVSEIALPSFLKQLTYFGDKLKEIHTDDLNIKKSLENLYDLNNRSISLISNYFNLTSQNTEETVSFEVKDWLNDYTSILHSIFGDRISIHTYCDTGMILTTQPSTLGGHIFKIINDVFSYPHEFAQIEIEGRRITGVETIHSGGFDPEKSYFCLTLMAKNARVEPTGNDADEKREIDARRNYTIWGIKQFVKLYGGFTQLHDDEEHQKIELYLPVKVMV